ncbi:MAG: hypothetical protein GYB55_20015 [Cytophagales bacterium]|uniref:Uncharacterized protein n=1 Tax=Cyclobacterium marinum (strain ATCC 25205 / DSM 745 / LMG 13164 / NCIMB 1802) TaxID=880070 RepID=G0IXI1_CYCMS|nr:hypothetical protein Cycma_3449 [Cyclobacterium marinum DSM 745]MBR9777173.1 hypothetical protein [Cytophagales bacterium]
MVGKNLHRGNLGSPQQDETSSTFPNVDPQVGPDEIVIFNGIINTGARWLGQNYEAALGFVLGDFFWLDFSLVRFFSSMEKK